MSSGGSCRVLDVHRDRSRPVPHSDVELGPWSGTWPARSANSAQVDAREIERRRNARNGPTRRGRAQPRRRRSSRRRSRGRWRRAGRAKLKRFDACFRAHGPAPRDDRNRSAGSTQGGEAGGSSSTHPRHRRGTTPQDRPASWADRIGGTASMTLRSSVAWQHDPGHAAPNAGMWS